MSTVMDQQESKEYGVSQPGLLREQTRPEVIGLRGKDRIRLVLVAVDENEEARGGEPVEFYLDSERPVDRRALEKIGTRASSYVQNILLSANANASEIPVIYSLHVKGKPSMKSKISICLLSLGSAVFGTGLGGYLDHLPPLMSAPLLILGLAMALASVFERNV